MLDRDEVYYRCEKCNAVAQVDPYDPCDAKSCHLVRKAYGEIVGYCGPLNLRDPLMYQKQLSGSWLMTSLTPIDVSYTEGV